MWTIENQLFIFVHNLHVLMNNVLTKTGTTTTKCLTDFPHLIEELKRKTKDLQNVQTSEMNQFEPENEKKKSKSTKMSHWMKHRKWFCILLYHPFVYCFVASFNPSIGFDMHFVNW